MKSHAQHTRLPGVLSPKAGCAAPARRRLRRALLAACLCWGAAFAAEAAAQERREARGEAAGRAIPAGEVLVVLNEQTFNAILEGMLTLAEPPTFPLKRGGEASARCASEVTLARESQGVRTAVRFNPEGRIWLPIAFRGTYEAALLGCLKFEGWADAGLDLEFDRGRQALLGRVRVRDVRLKDIPSLLTNGVTLLVQDAIDRRFNPLEILRAEQLGARLPVRAGAPLRLRAREVRHEVAPKELRLRIVYEVVREH